MKAFINGLVYYKGEFINIPVRFNKNIISFEMPKDTDEIINLKGLILSPGFIDTHIHGINSYDVMDMREESIYEISKVLVKNGTTSFLATTMTMEKDRIIRSLSNVRKTIKSSKYIARPLGVHLEGPFISKKHIGAQENIVMTFVDGEKVYKNENYS